MEDNRLNLIKSKISAFDVEYIDIKGTPCACVSSNDVIDVCKILKNDEDIKFDMLRDEFGIDNFQKKDRFEVTCNLYSTKFLYRFFVKIKLDSKKPEMPSLTEIWNSANWYEREVYDMYGINFINHPDLRRMYMPEEFEYFPLRKDFPLIGIPGSIPLPKK